MTRKMEICHTPLLLHPSGAAVVPSQQAIVLATPSDSTAQLPLFEQSVPPCEGLKALIADYSPEQIIALVTNDDGTMPCWLAGFPIPVIVVGRRHLDSLQVGDIWFAANQDEDRAGLVYAAEEANGGDFQISEYRLGLPHFFWPDS